MAVRDDLPLRYSVFEKEVIQHFLPGNPWFAISALRRLLDYSFILTISCNSTYLPINGGTFFRISTAFEIINYGCLLARSLREKRSSRIILMESFTLVHLISIDLITDEVQIASPIKRWVLLGITLHRSLINLFWSMSGCRLWSQYSLSQLKVVLLGFKDFG